MGVWVCVNVEMIECRLSVGFLSQFEADTMDIDNLNGGVVFEIFTKFGNIDVHTAGGKVGVVLPNFLQSTGAVNELVEVNAEETEKFAFL